jgi:integrase
LADDKPVIRSRRRRAGKTQPLGEDGIRDLIKELFGRCGIHYQGHDLRHTFCTLIMEAGGDDFLAMRLACDKIPGVNDRYINTSPVNLGESLKKNSPVKLIRHEQTGEALSLPETRILCFV